MSGDRWTDRLSEYLDGQLETAERGALEAHLSSCAACRSTLVDLETLVREATLLPATDPPRDLWPGIEGRIRQDAAGVTPLRPRPARTPRLRYSMPRLAAAAVAAVALGASALWLAVAGGPEADGPVAVAPAAGTGAGGVSLTALPAVEEEDYQAALDRLERSLAERRDELDPATVRVIEESMAVIDAALEEATEALERDPASAYLNRHYDATMRKKINLLRRAANADRAVS